MAALVPQPLSALLRRIEREKAATGKLFDLPPRRWWTGSPLDLSVQFHGKRAATAAGPAAGPQSQLAQNIALAWLAGSRILELKTIQTKDQLDIPRPCIDVTNVGYNVEWSQELRLEESLDEYIKSWLLLHILKKLNPLELRSEEMDTIFDTSVGYSLAGIQSDRVAKWLDDLRDAKAALEKQRDGLDADVRHLAEDVEAPAEIYNSITLSTFHGCPADEIEKIVERLYMRHDVHVIVKLNPTLLGYELVSEILHDRLGYLDIKLDKPSFDKDLQWDHSLSMMRRLESAAAKAGKTLGVKFTNTLVVENHRDFFPEGQRLMYLSGAPLHVLAVQLAHRFTEATNGRYPITFSAGVDKSNFHEVVACGIAPVTTCTDLLRPGGYGRLTRYLENLETEMDEAGARSVAELAEQRGGVRKALADYAQRVLVDPRYAVGKNSSVPRQINRELKLFDCINCDKCVPVCPNDANFTVETTHTGPVETVDLVVAADGKQVDSEPAGVFELEGRHQIANFADFCNDCGNCDVFCPETGAPYVIKPRFFSREETYQAFPNLDGFYLFENLMVGRVGGLEHRLRFEGDQIEFSDGQVFAKLNRSGELLFASAKHALPGHRLPLWRFHAMRALYEGVVSGVNPVSARIA